eukprot:TRINITY_DN771_c0_g2_i2.p1 TRINITY_DN771_c0_g2~~TRINITY_DN771_c0_g2_i2.p1  ORF type:complete len:240 (-),score=69.59 TRINITY_DN771_c0_g2_i2:92-811(-)
MASGIKKTIKVVVVGDGAVGKTCLLIYYTTKAFPQDYVPTVFDNYSCIEMYAGKPINLVLWDTAGQEDYDKLRPLSYPQTDVFVLCYSAVGRDSFINVEHKWLDEITQNSPGTPYILVATKRDLREDKKVLDELTASGQEPVSASEGEGLMHKIGAQAFFETSALEGKGIGELFSTCISTVMNKPVANGKKGATKKPSSASASSSSSSSKEDLKGKGKAGAEPKKETKKQGWSIFGKKK